MPRLSSTVTTHRLGAGVARWALVAACLAPAVALADAPAPVAAPAMGPVAPRLHWKLLAHASDAPPSSAASTAAPSSSAASTAAPSSSAPTTAAPAGNASSAKAPAGAFAVPPSPSNPPLADATTGPTNDDRGRFMLPPFVWWEHHGAQSTRILFPLWTRVSDGSGTTDAVLPPLLWRFHDDRARATSYVVFPLAAWHDEPRAFGLVVGPAYGWHDDRGWAGGVFPIAFAGDRNGRSHQALLPLFLHAHDEARGTDTLAVTLGFLRRSPSGFDAGLFPLLFTGRHDDRRYFTLAGLYTYKSDAHSWQHVLGPLYLGGGDDGYDVGVAPLLHASRSGTRHLRWIAPPLYFHYDDTSARKQLTLIGPLFKVRSGDAVTQGLFPLLWGVDRTDGAGHRHYDVALPLFAHARDDGHHTDTLWIGPYVRRRDDRRDATTHVLLPFGAKHDEPGYHALVQFPFFWKVEDGDTRALAVFPFYLRVRRPDLDADVGFPLVWRFRQADTTTTVVASAFVREAKDRFDLGVLPLFGFGKTTAGPRRTYSWSLPLLYWHSSDEAAGTSRTIFSLFLWDRTKSGWTSALVPLYTAWRRDAMLRVVGPGFYHGADDDRHRALTIAGPLYFGHDESTKRFGVAPLLFTSWGAKADDPTWNATLFPLFHAGRKHDGFRFLTLLGGFTTYANGGKGWLLNVYARRDKDGWSAAVVPLFYHSTDGEGASATKTTLLLPLFFRHSTPEKALTAVTPLFWRYRTIVSSTSVLFPLFFDQHFFFESRTSGVVPLFIRHHNEQTGESHYVIPPLLFWLHTHPEGNDFSLFPIVWRISTNHGARRVTLALPFFMDFNLDGAHTQVLAPFYTRLERREYNLTVVFNSYYLRGKAEREGTYTVRVLPFFSFSRPNPGDLEWRVFEGLVGYSRIGTVRTLRLFWVGDVALSPSTTAPATTFFGPASPSDRRTFD